LKKNCSHAERAFLSFGEWCRSSAFGEGAALINPVTACLAVALAKAGAKTTPKLKKTAPYFSPTVWLQFF
jgi:hypothetical protein